MNFPFWFYLAAFLLLAFGACVPCYRIMRAWLVDGELETLPALGLVTALLVATGLLWRTGSASAMIMGMIFLVGASFTVPFLLQRGEKEERRQLCDADIEKYLRALEFDPNNAGAHAMLGERYLESGRHVEAASEYQRAIELNPHSPNLGTWRRKLKDSLAQGEKV